MTSSYSTALGLTRQAALYFVLGAACLTSTSLFVVHVVPFSYGFLVGALVPYSLAGVIAVARIGDTHPFGSFGNANTLTLARLMVCSLIGGLAFELAINGASLDPSAAWIFCALALGAMLLDGLDGYTARRENMISAFGARFDMEVDALQILLLCVVAAALGKAGLWVLIGGLLRYAYELVGAFWPVLRNPLPPSFRRKLASVIEGGILAALLAPVVTPPASSIVAGAALLLLVYSFAVDVIWLAMDDARKRRRAS